MRDDRTIGERGLPYGIWHASISRFLDDADVFGEARVFFTHMICALDQEYISVVAGQIKQAIDEAANRTG